MAKKTRPRRIKICGLCGDPFESIEDEDTCGCVDSNRKRKSAEQKSGNKRFDAEPSPWQEKVIRELEDGLPD